MRKMMKRFSCILLAICVAASFAVTAFAAETDDSVVAPGVPETTAPVVGDGDGKVDHDAVDLGVELTHLDVKAIGHYSVKVDGEVYALEGNVVPESIVVTVKTVAHDFNYKFADFAIETRTEDGMVEYRINLNGVDGNLLNAIDWSGASFYMNNLFVSGRYVFENVPEALQAHMDVDAEGNYYVDFTEYRYTGVQECTCGHGLRSQGNCGVPTGVDLFLNVVGEPIETPEPETTVPETTEPEVTEPETTEPEATEPEATEPEVTEPETTAPETTAPAVDDVPDTGDNTKLAPVMILMAVSLLGMAVTFVVGSKAKYTAKH